MRDESNFIKGKKVYFLAIVFAATMKRFFIYQNLGSQTCL